MSSIIAICSLTNTTIPNLKGQIEFIEENNKVIININIKGLTPGLHGFHIHEAGDLTDNCTSACSHFNPHHKSHGGPNDIHRHIGDLGNIKANKEGISQMTLIDDKIKLKGKYSILGRSVVIHENPDDLGKGGLDKTYKYIINEEKYNESLKTGNAGKRVACGVIGYSSKMFTTNVR